MKYDRNYLISMYNFTSTGDGKGGIETYRTWLERQLISRIERLEEVDKAKKWIQIKTEEDLPKKKHSRVWVVNKNHQKVQQAIYYNGHFSMDGREYGLWPWNLFSHYLIIEKPELP